MTSSRAFAALFVLLLLARGTSADSAQESPRDQATNAAKAEMAAFSAGNRAAFVAAFSPNATILDDTPPFVWTGREGAGRWFDANRPGVRDVSIIPSAPTDFAVTPEHTVYVVLPITIRGHGPRGRAFVAHGYWTGVLVRNARGALQIEYLTVSLSG